MPSEKKLIKRILNALNEERKRKRRRRHHRSRRLRSSSRAQSPSPPRSPGSSSSSFTDGTRTPDCSPERESEAPDALETEIENPFKEALGKDYEDPKKYSGNIHTDINKRLEFILTSGLSKEERDIIVSRHTVPENCTLLDSPLLNPEVKAILTESSKLRDLGIEISQKHVGLATAIIAKAMTDLIQNDSNDKHKLLADLTDATKILTDVHYHQTKTRIKLISPLLDKNFNSIVFKTKRDSFLYGENLAELLKNVKQIQQSATQIKKPAPTPVNNRMSTTTNGHRQGNRQGPPPKTTKVNARGGPPKTYQPNERQQPRQHPQRHRPKRTAPQHGYQNAATRR